MRWRHAGVGLLVLIGSYLATPRVVTQVVSMVVPGGPTLPATCQVRNVFFKTGSDPGLYTCNETDTWTGPLGTGSGGSAPADATYITQTANGSLSAEQALGLLATGVLKSTTTTGVVSIAVAGTDYLAPDGSGAALTSLNATQLTSGTIPDGRFPATLPAASGANLTALPWASLTGVPAAVTALSGTNTGDQFLWSSLAVSGQTTLTPSSTATTLTLVAGSNITLTTDNTTKTLTITATGGGGAPSDAQYWVGAPNGTLSAEKDLSALATALVLNTAGTPSAYTGIDCTDQFVRDVSGAGAGTCNAVALASDISGFGTGVATALGINIGAAGAPVLFNGAGGTPTSLTLSNATGLPISTGVSGLGTGVATALGVNVGSAGAFVTFNGAGGTPSSITLTNATGLVLTTGVTGILPLANGGTAANLADPGADRILFWDDSAGAVTWLTAGSGLTITDTTITATGGSAGPYPIGLTIDGGGAVITTGFKGCQRAVATGTINLATIISTDGVGPATSGSIVVDVWKDTFANYPPDDSDSITASAPPTLSTDNEAEDATLTGWTTSVTAGDFLCFNVDSATTVTRVTVTLRVQP